MNNNAKIERNQHEAFGSVYSISVSVFTEYVRLSVSPKITAEHGKPVTLQCNVSSSLNGLKIKHIGWSNSKMSCSVDSEGNITYQKSLLNDFHCEYKDGKFSLIFEKVEPHATEEPYGCKLRSNQGIQYKTTAVELQGQSLHLLYLNKQ